MQNLDDFKVNFPFISGIQVKDVEYICIIQNSDEKIISFYDYATIRSAEEKKLFLSLGETWWWESARTLPINIFLSGQMRQFRYCLKTIMCKDAQVLFGPCTSLNNIIQKRMKKRHIQLIRRID